MNVAEITKFQYAMLGVLGSFCLLFSTFIYNACLKNKETRTLMCTASFINLFGSVLTLLFVLQITFVLSPMAFIILTTTMTDTLYLAYTSLPGMVLFAKLIPLNIESSMFALLTGLMNFSNLFASK